VTREDDWLRVIGAIDKLDGLVNAAGIAALGSIEDTDFCDLAQGPRGEPRRHLPRLQARHETHQAQWRRDREPVVGVGACRRA